jgi:hypothetical protein
LNGSTSPAFARYIGIDYSGAETPTSSLKGLRVYLADRTKPPEEVLPPPSPRKYSQVLDPPRRRGVVGGAVGRRPTHPGRRRSRLLVSAPVLRGPSPARQLAHGTTWQAPANNLSATSANDPRPSLWTLKARELATTLKQPSGSA